MLATTKFPLADWFDLTKPISQINCKLAEDQMALCAYKDGLQPGGEEWQQAVAQLRAAVKQHNKGFSGDTEVKR